MIDLDRQADLFARDGPYWDELEYECACQRVEDAKVQEEVFWAKYRERVARLTGRRMDW